MSGTVEKSGSLPIRGLWARALAQPQNVWGDLVINWFRRSIARQLCPKRDSCQLSECVYALDGGYT